MLTWQLGSLHAREENTQKALDEQLGNHVMEHHIVNRAFQLMDQTRNPSIASDRPDASDNLYHMSQNFINGGILPWNEQYYSETDK